MNSPGAEEMMGSEDDDNRPLGSEPTEEERTDVIRPNTVIRPIDAPDDLATQEAQGLVQPQVTTIEMLAHGTPRDDPTVGIFLEEIEQTVGIHLQADGLHEAETKLTPDTPWRGLHPISLGVNLLPRAWKTIRNMWPVLIFVVIGGERVGMRFVDMLVVLLFALLSVWNTFIHWATLRYRIHQGRLEIRQGLLNRQARTIDPARIQNVELVQNLFHTWTGLVELRIDTAGEQTTEGLLSALSVEEATTLQNQLANLSSLAGTGDGVNDNSEVVVEMGMAEILAFGLTQRTIGTVALITAVGLELLSQTSPDVAADFTVNMQPAMIVAAFMLAFVASWAVSAISSLFRYFGYAMVRLPETIRTTQGLTTKRRVEIPLSKVQMLRIDEPLMRRWMGFGTVHIETAGLSYAEGEQRQAEGIVPMVEHSDLGRVTALAAPHASIDPWTAPLKPAHPRSLYRALVAATVRSSVMIGLGMSLFGPIRWVLPALLPIALVGAWLDWKKQGWLVTPSAIVSRRGFFNRRTFIIARDKLQSVHRVQGPFMRLHGLSRLVVSVAGSRVSLPETGLADSEWIEAELSRNLDQ
jgi:putative membrane protein